MGTTEVAIPRSFMPASAFHALTVVSDFVTTPSFVSFPLMGPVSDLINMTWAIISLVALYQLVLVFDLVATQKQELGSTGRALEVLESNSRVYEVHGLAWSSLSTTLVPILP